VLTNQALLEFGQKYRQGRAQKDPKPLPPLPRTYLQNLGLLPHYGGYVPGENSLKEAVGTGMFGWESWEIAANRFRGVGGDLRSCDLALSLDRKGN
jgi:hypothetical protein